MNETRSLSSLVRRAVIPLLIAAALVIATLVISGSTLLRIEDMQVNRVLAGAYGSPDWRVQELNPLLSQILMLLYSVIPAVNWYGCTLLALLCLSVAGAISLAAKKRGGLLPVAIAISPLTLLLTNVMISSVVSTLATGVGALLLMDALTEKPRKAGALALGAVLFLFGSMLTIGIALIVTIAIAVCFLPSALKEKRLRGLLIGLPAMAVLLAALFGYSALMYSSEALSAYRSDYALYDRLQHSSLVGESNRLMTAYGVGAPEEEAHVHEEGDGHAHEEGDSMIPHMGEAQAEIPPNVFDSVGWSLNDAAFFFGRNATDSTIVDPEVLHTLAKEAEFISFDPGFVFSELFETLQKPQFLLLILVFIACALGLIVTCRGNGLIAVLAALIAFGGHILSLMKFRDSFSEIAPYYLLATLILFYHFDGEEAKVWFRRVLVSRWLRWLVSAAVLAAFAGGMAGLFYYTANRSISGDPSTVYIASQFIAYTEQNPDTLFIGDNPYERFQPETLVAPVRGADKNLFAGSYDLYSPRRAAMIQAYNLTNPLTDSLGRSDIGYIAMAYKDPLLLRLASAHSVYIKDATMLKELPGYGESIFRMIPYTQQELDEQLEKSGEAPAETGGDAEPVNPEADAEPSATAAPDA